MKRYLPYALIILSLCLWATALVVAQDDEGDTGEDADAVQTVEIEVSDFAGTRECNDCHRAADNNHRGTPHDITLVEIEEDDDPEDNPIVADFSVGADVREVTLPGSSSAAPFEQADVAFTLGAGRHVQAYIYRDGDPDDEEAPLYVLPAEWDVIAGEWTTLQLGEGDEWPSDAYAFGPNCAGCHVVGLDIEDYTWREEGVSCESCHGPGEDHVEAADDAGGSVDEEERAAILGSINIAIDSQTCGQCHVRGLASDGVHPYPTTYYPGMTLADHFEAAAPDDETHFWATGHARLPNMQYNESILSAHPNALSAIQDSDGYDATCLECHSAASVRVDQLLANDEIDPETVDPLAVAEEFAFGVNCSSCHHPHQDVEEDAEPNPMYLRTSDNYALCVSCHYDSDSTEGLHHPVQEVYEGTTLIEGIDGVPSAHFTAEDGPTCSTCHMQSIETYNGDRSSHLFNIVPPGEALDLEGLQDSCSGCHDDITPAALQQLIDDIQVDTRSRIETARETVTDDTPMWVTRALDAVEGDGSAGIHNYAYADDLLDAVEFQLGLVEEPGAFMPVEVTIAPSVDGEAEDDDTDAAEAGEDAEGSEEEENEETDTTEADETE